MKTANPNARTSRASKTADSRTAVVERQRQAERTAKMDSPLITTSARCRKRFQAILKAAPGITADTQADRLLKAMRGGAVTSFQARDDLDIVSPASRVHTLRHVHGINILCSYVRQASACGTVHTIGSYSIIREPA